MLNNYTCIIVDDELDAIELLSSRLMKLYDNVTVIATFSRWQEALSALRHTKCDLLMMDISMPGKTGINLLKLIPDLNAEIIFVTAHDNYALEAFELAASGYILKPVDDAELQTTVNKAMERVLFKKQANLAPGTMRMSDQTNGKIAVPSNHGIDYINVASIIYLESINKYTKITTTTGEYVSTNTIGKFQYLIENYSFFQIHRSFIINLNNVSRYESAGIIIMSDKKEVPISRSVKNDFLRILEADQRG